MCVNLTVPSLLISLRLQDSFTTAFQEENQDFTKFKENQDTVSIFG